MLITVYIENIFSLFLKDRNGAGGWKFSPPILHLQCSPPAYGLVAGNSLISSCRFGDSCLLLLVKSSLFWICSGSILWYPAAVSCYGVLLWYPAVVSAGILSSDAWPSPLAHLLFLFSFKKELCLSLCSGTPTRHA